MSGTQAIDRAAELVSLVVHAERPRSFGELIDETGLAKSTGSRLLHALERHQLLRRDEDGYRPGALFALHAARQEPWTELARLAAPTLQRIGAATGETINLAVPSGNAVVEIAQVDATYVLGAVNWVGVDVPAHCTAIGKVLYAHSRITLPAGPLERRTAVSVVDPSRLRAEFALVRRRGYATTRGELEPGLDAVAVAVHDAVGVVAAVSVSGPDVRLASQLDELGQLLLTETAILSVLLGHRPESEGAA